MSFTKKEVYEYLSIYPIETIPLVLAQLGFEESVDEFPDDVVQRVERIYETMGFASETQKMLATSMGNENQQADIVTRQVGDIAFSLLEEKGISLPLEVVAVLAQHTVQEAAELADGLARLRERAFTAQMTDNNISFANKLMSLSENASNTIEGIFDDESQAMLLQSGGLQTSSLKPQVAAFIAGMEARKKATGDKKRYFQKVAQQLPVKNSKAYLKAFLEG